MRFILELNYFNHSEMKFQIINKIILIAVPLISLSGCLNYYQETKLYTDGSGYMKIDYWMLLPDRESIDFVDKLGIFNPDSIRNQFKTPFSTIENVEVYKDTTDSTTHAIIEFSFSHIDSLNKSKTFSDYHFTFTHSPGGLILFTQFIPPVTTGFGIDASAYTVTYKYIFPGDIITHNAHNVSGRTLTWEYKLSEIGGGKTLSVTFRPFKLKETPAWIYMLSGFVLVVVIYFLFRKRKN